MTIRAIAFGFVLALGATARVASAQVPNFSHVFVIVMENKEYSDIVGNAAAPYINSLARQYGIATNYFAITHPSLPDYMALTSGDTFFTDDCIGCTTPAVNLADRIEASGRTWTAYMEDMPAPCTAVESGLYSTRHNPFVHYADIVNNAARCNAHVVPFSQFGSDLAANRLANLVWISPNVCNDMHDCSIATGDSWLASVVPQILQSPAFANSVLFLTWDEGTTSINGGGQIPLIVASPFTNPGFQSGTFATHYSLLRTIEDAWNLSPLGQSPSATAMSSFFQPGAPLPSPWSHADIGAVGLPGSASYSSPTFTVQGSGGDIWGSADGFHFVYQPINGDAQIIARVTSEQNPSAFAKAGVMIRQTLDSGSAHVVFDLRPTTDLEFMTRPSAGAQTTFLATARQAPPTWLKLVRTGSTIAGSVSADGSNWRGVGTTTLSIGPAAFIGLVVSSASSGALNTATFDNVSVSAAAPPPPPPPPPPGPSDVVIYASDIPSTAIHGSWFTTGDPSAAAGIKLATPDNGWSSTSTPLAAPVDYVDVTFNASAATPYTLWLRLKATANSKWNDSIWVQFSDARANGAPAYPINTTSALLVNLATDSAATSLNAWGWQNGAYWLSQPTTITFANSGSHTLRIQVREDGVQFDQIVLSPSRYLNSAPGPVTADTTIVPK